MRKGILKKSAAFMLAATMVVSMAGCGGKSGDGKKKDDGKESENTKDMVYAGEELNLKGIEGDLSTIYIQGEKMYISTYEWIEEEGASKDGADAEKYKETDDSESKEETSEETTGVEDEESTSEDTSSEEDEKETSEEETSEEETVEESEGKDGTGDETDAGDVAEEDIEMPEGTSVERMYSANLDGSDLKEITLPEKAENEYMNQMFVGEDGTFTFINSSYDEKKGTSSYFIVQADESGKEISKEDITKTLNLGQDGYFNKVVMDKKGNFVFVLESQLLVLDAAGKKVCELKAEKDVWLEGAVATKDGQIVVGYSGEEGACVQVADIEGKKWGEKYNLSIQYFSGSDSLMTGSGEYDLYYKNDSGIFGYTFADKKEQKIMDYMASNISSENTYGMMPYTEGKFISNTYDENGNKLIVYSKVDPSTIKDKQSITMAMMWVDDEIKKAAMEFNKNNDKYQIEIKDYSNEEDPETKMNADIIAGNIADIICLSNLPAEQYVAKGILEDLTPYFEKDDEVNPDEIIDSVREAMKVDGKYYYVVPNFNVSTLIASTKDVGTEMGWTFDDLKKLLDEKGNGVRPFYSENKSEMLYSFAGSLTGFVDWTTGECSFDSQDFKDILEMCNRGTNEEQEYSEDNPSLPTLIQEGKVLFNEGSIGLGEIQLYKAMFKDGMTFIGYPNAEKEGSYFTFNSNMGIYSKSEVKEGAWEFIRTFMTKDYQGKQVSSGNMQGTPTRKDALELKNKIAMATKKFKDEYGNEHEPEDSSWGWDDLEVKIKPSTQEEVDMYMDLINSTKKVGGWNQEILDIILEESKAYFSGDKNVDETADIIQNRVKTYVNENR
ncbi:MAG: hypothetical protein PUC12_10750 [Clostridiales bacterium]|nr:hypothetical protein [Clostridiales bacterium]